MRRSPTPDAALADALSGLREARGLSREALAFRSGVTPGTLASIELAELVPRWDTVRLLARGLDATLTELCDAVEREEAFADCRDDRPPA
ncbi:MAG: helix-turn-helix domain-containing protein [Solirubrobacteraceae bacterium]